MTLIYCQRGDVCLHYVEIAKTMSWDICLMANACVNVNLMPRLTQGILIEKGFVCQNPHPTICFLYQNPHEKIYIFTICKVRMMSENTVWSNGLLSNPWPPPRPPTRIYFDRCITGPGYCLESLGKDIVQ